MIGKAIYFLWTNSSDVLVTAKKKIENSDNWYIPMKTICLKELSKVIIGKYYVS